MRKLSLSSVFKVPSISVFVGEHKHIAYLCKSVLITLLSLLLAHVVKYDLENITGFASSDSMADFEMSDIYNAMSDHRHVSYASPYVSVVSVDQCTRQEVLEVLELIAEYSPKAIGLDIFFRTAADDSTYVLQTLGSIPQLVLPCMLEEDEDGVYHRQAYSFVESSLSANYGYVNLNASTVKDVVRDFSPWRVLQGGDTLKHIATAMARIAAPERYAQLMERHNPLEIIKFSSVDIPIISAQEVFYGAEEDYLTRYLTDRAVFVGDIENINDMYSTPLKGMIPGIMIHAYSLNTVLTAAYTNVTSDWLNWLLAIVLCVLFLYAHLLIKERWSYVGNLLMRMLQIMLMFGMVIIGSYWYNKHLQYIDFSLIVLTIGFSALACDVYDGIYALCVQIKQYIQKKKVKGT